MMKTNFYFLEQPFPEIFNLIAEAERSVKDRPRTSVIYARLSLETMIRWIYRFDPLFVDQCPEHPTLEAMMYAPTFKNLMAEVGVGLQGLTLIRKSGNQAVHSSTAVSMRYAHTAIHHLFDFAKWFCYAYVKETGRLPGAFDASLIPTAMSADEEVSVQETKQAMQQLEERLSTQQQETEQLLLGKEKEIDELREQIAQIKADKAAAETVSPPSFAPNLETEQETRRLLIDLMLRERGWDVNTPNCQEFSLDHMPTPSSTGRADYVLWGADGLPLAVVEAKSCLTDPANGKHQAQLYANSLEQRYSRRPIVFYTNGYETYIWDDQLYPPRLVLGVYTADELEWTISRRNRRPLKDYQIKPEIADRGYQVQAIKAVADAFDKKQRKALLVMATGTGKTRTAIALVDMLFEQGWIRRVLFLSDRTALLKQAKRSFVQLLGQNLSCVNLSDNPMPAAMMNSRIVFATYPTICNRIDTERIGDAPLYTPGFFDLIIIDEVHRSVYQKYRAIFSYFDAMLVGLTATPRNQVDRNTYELFNLEDNNPTTAYELNQAVQDGYLVPPKAIKTTTSFLRQGIKYDELSEKDKERYESDFDIVEDSDRDVESTAINNYVFNEDTVDKILDQLMTQGLCVEGGEKIGKTIIFATNHRHALFIQERFHARYPFLGGNFIQVIDNYVTYADDLIDRFAMADEMPQIAVSVDMLDTGIDVPEILNLVFFKLVKSHVKFWQMLGRGTRLCPEIFGPAVDEQDKTRDKKEFLILDCCGNLDFFKISPQGIESSPTGTISQAVLSLQISLAEAISALPTDDLKTEELQAFRKQLLDIVYGQLQAIKTQRGFRADLIAKTLGKYQSREDLDNLSGIDAEELVCQVAPLAVVQEPDEMKRRFDLMMLRTMWAKINESKSIQRYVRLNKDIAQDLLAKQSVPAVGQRVSALRRLQDWTFDDGLAAIFQMESVRQEVREIVNLLDKKSRAIIYTDLTDEVDKLIEVASVADVMDTYVASPNYKQRVEQYVRENQTNLVIQKLKKNEPVTAAELDELERILFDGKERGSQADFERYNDGQSLGKFVRSIVGMDQQAVEEAFISFVNACQLNSPQHYFVSTIISYLTNGHAVNVGMLYNPPFNQRGSVDNLFDPEGANDICSIVKMIDQNASPLESSPVVA